jgi:hypothetical protein
VKPKNRRARSKGRAFSLDDYTAARDGRQVSAPKKHKYGAKAVIGADGKKTDDSTKEGRRRWLLETRERLGEISDLRCQVRYEFVINGFKVCAYVADFVYLEDGREIVEDVKSVMTRKLREYRIKVKLMKAVFGITVVES